MRFSVKLLVMVWAAGFGTLMGQPCGAGGTTWSHPGKAPSFLQIIVGSYPRPSAATWDAVAAKSQRDIQAPLGPRAVALLHAGKAKAASALMETRVERLLADSLPDSSNAKSNASDLEVAAVAALVEGRMDRASVLLQKAVRIEGGDNHCRLRMMQLLVSYLETYGAKPPMFPHFNSGFYNYLQDSLRWDPTKGDENGYLVALNTVTLLYRLDPLRQGLYMELLGDLLSKEPNRFHANYFSALAYLRAGQILGGEAQQVFDRKAIFALEAPRQAEIRFNQYRFTQLKKIFIADIAAAAAAQAEAEARDAAALQGGKDPLERFSGTYSNELISTTFFEDDFGNMPAILAKSKAQIEAREGEAKKYSGDVDLKKEVKKDSLFNTFALFLILTIVAAVVFIWRKLRKAS